MKRIFTSLFVLLIFSATGLLQAQPYQYFFNNTLAEEGAVGPTLTEELTCAAVSAGFSLQNINTSGGGQCGTTPKTTFDFNAGGGLQFDNTGALIGAEYTIHMLFKFNSLVNSQRILDFTNATADQGLYSSDDCISLSGSATLIGAATCPNIVAGEFLLVSVTRNGATDEARLYIDGVPFETFDDQFGDYIPTSFIRFFLDDACETGPGSIKYLSINPVLSDDLGVANFFTSLCSVTLPLHFGNFSANKQNAAVVLSWNAVSEPTTSHFELERSDVGNNFARLTDIPVSGGSNTSVKYSYTDKRPLSGLGYYRIKIVDQNGSFKYSTVLKINFSGQQKFDIYPNPVKSVVTLTGVKTGGRVKLINVEGKELMQRTAAGETFTIDLAKFPTGVYYVQYYDGEKFQIRRLIKN